MKNTSKEAPRKPAHKRQNFSGVVKFISCSPHGDPEAVVLEDGMFVRIPPHSLLEKADLTIGAEIEGSGELVDHESAKTIHHARIMKGKRVLADDSGSKEDREELKEKHKKDLEKRRKSEDKLEEIELSGTIAAIGYSPKGEPDRILLTDGTSIHLSKEMKLGPKERKGLKVGAKVEVEGESRSFDKMKFVKASDVKLH